MFQSPYRSQPNPIAMIGFFDPTGRIASNETMPYNIKGWDTTTHPANTACEHKLIVNSKPS